jgi:hypothetical protein
MPPLTKVSTAMKTAPTSTEVGAHVTAFDDNQLKQEIAILAFKTQSNGNLAKYNLIDQVVDSFEDSTGVSGSSTNATVNVNGYVSGAATTAHDPYSSFSVGDSQNSIDNATPRKMTVNVQGSGNHFVSNLNIGTSDLDLISNGIGYTIEYIVTDAVSTNPEWKPGFSTTNSGVSYQSDYKYDYTPSQWGLGDTLKTNIVSNGSTATITWSRKASGASVFTQVSQTTGLGITNWYPWVAAWNDGGSHSVTYTASYEGAPTNMTLLSNSVTASSPPTKGDLVVAYVNHAGTAVVGTDLKLYISRDGSAFTSSIPMTSVGTSGTTTILTANDVDLTGITSGTSMVYKLETLNQSVSKITRIHAVSLGWS